MFSGSCGGGVTIPAICGMVGGGVGGGGIDGGGMVAGGCMRVNSMRTNGGGGGDGVGVTRLIWFCMGHSVKGTFSALRMTKLRKVVISWWMSLLTR